MKKFQCTCGARLFFENLLCLNCKHQVGFSPDQARFVTATDDNAEQVQFLHESRQFFRCKNAQLGANCNWLVDSAEDNELCQACRLNRTIPNLSEPGNVVKWQEIEAAKRRLVYSLNALGLHPIENRGNGEPELAFDFLAATKEKPVLTGHSDGLITLNLNEADPVTRERVRNDLNEPYRTLLGHFRHEVGHYYFQVLVSAVDVVERFRALFGDERADYEAALKAHYETPPEEGWHERFITAYAAAHPHEDWAETWAHYLHMVDALETVQENALLDAAVPLDGSAFERMLSSWQSISVALNEVNRSLGQNDAYPFAVSETVMTKLAFVHEVISARMHIGRDAPDRSPGV